ncbi:3908_t:CDS:2 [Dentiscutata heterogama]|uniref:3908_t:CDS:1 n=1 Tax=Dentiscutata heterogama TaxID=1316150 RepID=A0ACA9KBC5_9GLOM|nr:3908_t:CDS:2 [Dentiscutata heterogama]
MARLINCLPLTFLIFCLIVCAIASTIPLSEESTYNENLLNSDNMLQTETTIADMKNIPKYTVEEIKYENIPEKEYIYQLEPISTDSVETNNININEVDSSQFRRIGFGGRMYSFRRGFFNVRGSMCRYAFM